VYGVGKDFEGGFQMTPSTSEWIHGCKHFSLSFMGDACVWEMQVMCARCISHFTETRGK
jgi:hypothetical protein